MSEKGQITDWLKHVEEQNRERKAGYNNQPFPGCFIDAITTGKNAGKGFNAYHQATRINRKFLFGPKRNSAEAYDAAFAWLEAREAQYGPSGELREPVFSQYRRDGVRKALTIAVGAIASMDEERLRKECEDLGIECEGLKEKDMVIELVMYHVLKHLPPH